MLGRISTLSRSSKQIVGAQSRLFCSYSKWIDKLGVITRMMNTNTYDIYIENKKDIKMTESVISDELYSWTDKLGLTTKKLKKAKVPQMIRLTGSYLNDSEMTDYCKIISFLYLIDDLYFDDPNNNDIDDGYKMVDDMINNNKSNDKLQLIYNNLLSLKSVKNKFNIRLELNNFLYFQLKEKEINLQKNIIHYNDYFVLNRRYSSGFILVFLYLSYLDPLINGLINHENGQSQNVSDHYMYKELVSLCSDIVILMNDLLGFDREYENGELCTYPLLVKYHDNCSNDEAQQKTFDLILEKINQYQTLLNIFTHQFAGYYPINLTSWILGYYYHEINCNRQKKSCK